MANKLDIECSLKTAFSPQHIIVHDDSANHAGHAGARPEGGTHFRVDIVATQFTGKSRVERHRMVYDVLAGDFEAGLHALQINAKSPEEA